jgi:hypothetical protein
MSHPPPSFFAACRNSGTVECDEQWQIFVCNLFAQKLNQNYHIMPRVQKHDRIQNVNNVAFVLLALAIHFAALIGLEYVLEPTAGQGPASGPQARFSKGITRQLLQFPRSQSGLHSPPMIFNASVVIPRDRCRRTRIHGSE